MNLVLAFLIFSCKSRHAPNADDHPLGYCVSVIIMDDVRQRQYFTIQFNFVRTWKIVSQLVYRASSEHYIATLDQALADVQVLESRRMFNADQMAAVGELFNLPSDGREFMPLQMMIMAMSAGHSVYRRQ
jgi:hypothetical protein